MAATGERSKGPDLTKGIAADAIAEGAMVGGEVGGEPVLVARVNGEFLAIGAKCTHYSGPLAEGLLVGDTVRCPLHHACFSLRTGDAVRAPALAPVACWTVEVRAGRVFVRDKRPAPATPRRAPSSDTPGRIVIVGGGAAGFAAADMLRRRGYDGAIVLISDDAAAPVDRPNLSKDYLAGSAPDDWIPMQSDDWYGEQRIDLRIGTRVTAIDPRARTVTLSDGRTEAFDRLLLATGAEPVRLSIPGMDLPHVFTLRSFADARAIVARAGQAKKAVVMGASFIGLEVAASLRERQIEVHVVAPDRRPMERTLGPELGDLIRTLHEDHGVVFHLDQRASAIGERSVTLEHGATIDADLVVVGVGVRPRTSLAEQAGLAIDRGVTVNEFLETSVPGIYAAGDIARWPDPLTGDRIRVEHWVVAERQGQTAACNMLGARQPFDAAPFFWSQHYDVTIRYTGHAAEWDALQVEGDLARRDATVRYFRGGRFLAAASVGRDVENLRAEVELERGKPGDVPVPGA